MTKRILTLLLAALILLTAVPLAASADELVPTKAQIVSGVSFRDQPGTSSNLIRYLKTNEEVKVLQEVNPYWYKIEDGKGIVGYVSTSDKYIKIVSNAIVTYGVNMRKSPSSSGAVIRMLTKGEEVLVQEKVNDSWYKVQDGNGVVGYTSTGSKYLQINESVNKMVLPLSDRIESFINEGVKYMGTPYEFGSERFNILTFDCSDFVLQAFFDATGNSIPSDSRGQAEYVKDMGPVQTSWKNLKRGDLMFFMSYQGSKASDYSNVNRMTETVTHVGIYLGDGQMLHTYSPESGGVRIDSITDKSWELRYLYGGSFMQ